MSRPEPTPDRVDELLDGASPAGEQEREMASLVNEIQGLQDEPSPELRARVDQIASGAPAQGRRTWRERFSLPGFPALTGPRLAIAGGALAVVVIAAIAVPLGSDSDGAADLASADATEQEAPLGLEEATPAPNEGAVPRASGDEELPLLEGAEEPFSNGAAKAAGGAVAEDAIPPGPDQGRPQEVRVRTAVQVDGVDGLSRASSQAMTQVRELGGFTVSSRFSVPNSEFGTSDLVLKVPSERLEEALEGFTELGSVISQDASLVDLGEELNQRRVQITRQRERLASLRKELRENPGDEELTRQITLTERRLAALIEQRKQVLQRARMATIELLLTTDGPVAADEGENRFIAAFDRSWDRLATVLEWAISAAVFLVPLALLGWLGLALTRNLRRREAQRLMDAV
ncbi:MAG: DUF4349 domain-containing protein [Thermoleophilia bacterium]|nr:DUF4349 domain-containing protein [Thermoleophilia bacterium]